MRCPRNLLMSEVFLGSSVEPVRSVVLPSTGRCRWSAASIAGLSANVFAASAVYPWQTVPPHQSFGIFLKYFDVFLMVFDHGFDEGAVEACTGQHLEFQIGGLLADARARRRRDAELGRDLSGLLIVGGVTSI